MVKNKKRLDLSIFIHWKPWLLVGLVLLIMAVIAIMQPSYKPSSTSPQRESTQRNDTQFSPTTKEEKDETENFKKDLANQPSPPPLSSNSKKSVTPVITTANDSEIRAYVPGIFEEGGLCTAELTRGSQTIIKSSVGFEDVNKTTCAPINIAGQLGSGNWTVVVIYSSTIAEGKSETRTFEVP